MSEDCLFLDVFVPRTVFDFAAQYNATATGAPVLVWIFGGGFAFGSKEYWGNPATLIQSSLQNSADEVIFIALNYRVSRCLM